MLGLQQQLIYFTLMQQKNILSRNCQLFFKRQKDIDKENDRRKVNKQTNTKLIGKYNKTLKKRPVARK